MSSEQTFRWLSLFKTLLRPMSKGRFLFTLVSLCERHNERIRQQASAKAARRRPFDGVPGARSVGTK